MSTQITTAFVQQYNANVVHLAQQKGSRLAPLVRKKTIVGKSDFVDRIGAVVAIKKTSRHSDTPISDTPHSRRMLTLSDYEIADLVDQQDKIRTLINPTSEYAIAQGFAMGRAMDDELIAAAIGSAYGGETGSSAIVVPNSQKLLATDGTNGLTHLTVAHLAQLKHKFDGNEIDESDPRYIVCGSGQIQDLLSTLQVGSVDYNSVKSLVSGQINTFMGFTFVRSERLPVVTIASVNDDLTAFTAGSDTITGRTIIAFSGSGLTLGIGMDPVAKISERADKSYATQIYNSMTIGATRVEEEKVCLMYVSEA